MAGLHTSQRNDGGDWKHSGGSCSSKFANSHWLLTLGALFSMAYFSMSNFKIGFDPNVNLPVSSSVLFQEHAQMQPQQLNPLGIPMGKAQNLPSVRAVSDSVVQKARKIYGGTGDGKHLGGFTELDLHGVSPAVWKHMLQVYGVHSVLDVGCGRGTSTSWFALHNCSPVMCVEGSHDAIEKSIFGSIQPQSIVEHDFSRGPWWPEETFDAVWAVEFLEHVGVNFHYNYITAFRKAALLFVTSSRWGGWHHVEVHSDEWWIRKYESYGFKYDAQMTDEIRGIATAEGEWPKTDNRTVAPNGGKYNAQHIWLSIKVFVNPVVAALPQHAHLFPEHGCYQSPDENGVKSKVCGTGEGAELESVLPRSYWPLEPTLEQDEAWNQLIRQHITIAK